jgi:hypothetical protein
MNAVELREHLELLGAEKASAALEGLDHDGLYLADLLGEIATTRVALVGAAVTEIASLRAQLGGPQVG